MAYNLTTSGSPTYPTGKFSTAIDTTNGYLQYATNIWTSPGTIEGWVKTTYGNVAVAIGSDNGTWIGVDANHYAHAVVFGGNGDLISSTVINDGAWHHLALTYSGGNVQLWVDGALGASNTYSTSSGPSGQSSSLITIGRYGSNGYGWSGQIDEVRFSSVVRYTAAFTVATAAFTGDSSTIALYHLDSNGNDSAAVSSGTTTSTSRLVRSSDLTSLVLANSGFQTANVQTASYTLVRSDVGKAVEMNVSANAIVTVPPNSSVAFPIGSFIDIVQIAVGQVNLVAGSGVVFDAPLGTATYARYATIRIRQRATNEWVVSGSATNFYDPTTVSGLVYRMRASTLGITSDGSSVSSMPFETGGLTLTQGTAASQPTWRARGKNGKPYVSFDGVDDNIYVSSGAATYNQEVVISIAAQVYGGLNSQELFKAGGLEMLLNQSANTWSIYSGSLLNSSVTYSGVQIFTGVFGALGNQGSGQGYTNGVMTASGGSGGNAAGTDIYIGTHPNTPRYLWADIYEVLMYSATLSVADIAKVNAYMLGMYV